MDKAFLNVKSSILGRRWVDRLDHVAARAATAIHQQTGLSEILARILAARGVPLDGAEAFLNPTLRALMPDPGTLTDMEKLAGRLADAIDKGETIGLFGDYDVDGACAVALMVRFLSAFSQKSPLTHIPDRIYEGYGPNKAAMDSFIDKGATLIVTLDCGTSSHETIAHAKAKGVDILVIDHHLAGRELPPADALVNPNRGDDVSGLSYLCAAGVTFMALVATNRALRERGAKGLPDLMQAVDLVALATVCDVVPLVGLNRAFVQRGLELMRQGKNPGLGALTLAARLNGPVNAYHLGFLLGPRINAGGRIGDAGLGARLLASEDESEVIAIAARLDELNAERQRIEAEAVSEAMATAEVEIGTGEGPPVLVLASRQWHPGIVGLVAARLKERFSRPAFAIALGADGKGTGSGRSLPHVDMGSAVVAAVAENILQKGGGHAMAAGITLSAERIGDFRAFICDRLREAVMVARAATDLKIDAALSARGASAQLVHEVERAGPFGTGNPAPVFAFPAHFVQQARIVGKGGHVSFMLAAGDRGRIKAIAFRAAETPLGQLLLDARDGRAVHVCGTLGIDHWQGREQVQLRLIDAAPA